MMSTEGVKGLTKALMALILQLVPASKVSGGDGLLGFLGIQGFASKEVMGWQEALIARGTLTRSEINALITDSVKDVEGEVYNAPVESTLIQRMRKAFTTSCSIKFWRMRRKLKIAVLLLTTKQPKQKRC